MSMTLNRRHFLGAAVTAATAATLSLGLIDLLAEDSAPERVLAILKEHLGLADADRPLVTAFVDRLRTAGLHTEDPAVFQAWLDGRPGHAENLAAYLVEEFLITSNYLAFRAGEEPQLRLT